MKYYEIYRSDQQSTQGLFANFVDMNSKVFWSDGKKIDQKMKLPVQYIMERQGKAKTFFPEKLEYINNSRDGILIHNRVKKIFASLTKHHTMYESQIEYQGEKLPGPYYTMNLEVLRSAMEIEKSDFWMDEVRGKEYIASVHKLILSAKKLSQIPKDEHLFRLKEFTPITIIDEYGKDLIEEFGVVGVEFQELEIAEL